MGEFIIGCTTSFRMMQLLQHSLSVKPQDGEDDHAYMVEVVVESARTLFKAHGFSLIESNREEGGEFLIGYRGKLYAMYSDFSVLRYVDGFDAVGCGAAYALGALAVLDTSDPQAALLQALEVAERFSNGVRGPFHCESLP